MDQLLLPLLPTMELEVLQPTQIRQHEEANAIKVGMLRKKIKKTKNPKKSVTDAIDNATGMQSIHLETLLETE